MPGYSEESRITGTGYRRIDRSAAWFSRRIGAHDGRTVPVTVRLNYPGNVEFL
jgi:hypothetical protein